MVAWRQVETEAPEFAAQVRRRFDAGLNKTMATLRADGSPRISGTEIEFEDGRITLGMMPESQKLRDIRRDPRVAIHSPTLEPPKGQLSDWPGDAKVAGRLLEFERAEAPGYPPGAYFEVDVTEAVLTYMDETRTRLVIESWHDGRGWRKQSRT